MRSPLKCIVFLQFLCIVTLTSGRFPLLQGGCCYNQVVGARCSHDDGVGVDTIDAFVRQNFDRSQACLVLDLNVFSCASHIAHPDPASNRVLPTNDGVSEERVWLDNSLP